MCFKPRNLQNLYVPKVYLNGKPLQCVDVHKYLGVVLSNDATDNHDIMRQVKKYIYIW